MTEELKTIDTVDTSPFKKMVMTIGELPTSFVESMTYYELLAWLCNYLENTVIKAVNNNAEVSEELQAKFIELKSYVDNYFDNLDVQDEINNKLDAMAEAGTLQEIITTYIQANVAWTFDTVADMISTTNLVNGSYAQTLGFRSANDGGGAIYKISNSGTANEVNVIAVGELFAHLVYGTSINVKQFGCYCDDTHDDSSALQTGLNNLPNYVSEVIFNNNTDMLLSNVIDLTDISGIDFKFKGKIHRSSSATTSFCFRLTRCKNCRFEKPFIYSERNQTESAPSGHTRQTTLGSNIIGFIMYQCDGIDYIDCQFTNMASDFFNQPISSEDLTISNNINIDGWVSNHTSQPLFMQCCENIHINRANVTPAQNMGGGDHHLYLARLVKNVFVTNSIFTSPDIFLGVSVNFLNTGSNASYGNCPENLKIENCKFNLKNSFLSISFTSNARISNCEITINNTTSGNVSIFNIEKEPTIDFTNNKLTGDWEGYGIYNGEGATVNLTGNIISNTHSTSNRFLSSADSHTTIYNVVDNTISWTNAILYNGTVATTKSKFVNNIFNIVNKDATYLFSPRNTSGSLLVQGNTINNSGVNINNVILLSGNAVPTQCYFNNISGLFTRLATDTDLPNITANYNILPA